MSILREIGAHYTPDNGTVFTVWAPYAKNVEVVLHKPEPIQVTLQHEAMGYWTGLSELATPGTRYTFVLNGETERPDPASQHQPEGVHKSSAIVNHHAFTWTDKKWKNLPLHEYIIYELHVGTFTDAGTFEAMIERLPGLVELGITAIEIMPVAQFPGNRNWGYDGVFPFATQNSYGGPEGLKKLVDACHAQGLAIILDVVYNHMGPEGNYLNDFGPYFTDKYKTPWGTALNFDDNHADAVRNFFFQNTLMWLRDYHIDALRLDAVHAIYDMGAKHFLEELQEHVKELETQLGRNFILIAESDLNDVRLINPTERGGYGLDAQWSDDFHHVVHAMFTGEQDGYYVGFGKPEQLTKVMQRAFVYDGLYSEHRHRTFGNSTEHNKAEQFVVCSQNHDQVGNRMLGERLSELVDFETLKVIAGLVILSPFQPMLFMGEEYAEQNPFLYFVSHGDKDLIEAVRKGRHDEFSAFSWQGEAPDPQSEETFERSKLTRSYTSDPKQNQLREYYKRLIQIRKTTRCLAKPDKSKLIARIDETDQVLHLIHRAAEPYAYALFNLSDTEQTTRLLQPDEAHGNWKTLLTSAAEEWGGSGSSQPELLEQKAEITLPPKSVLILVQ